MERREDGIQDGTWRREGGKKAREATGEEHEMEAKGSGHLRKCTLRAPSRATHCPSNRDLCPYFCPRFPRSPIRTPEPDEKSDAQGSFDRLEFGSTERFSVSQRGTTVVSYSESTVRFKAEPRPSFLPANFTWRPSATSPMAKTRRQGQLILPMWESWASRLSTCHTSRNPDAIVTLRSRMGWSEDLKANMNLRL